ncbi:hypothetical protein LCGC14_2086690, partial [marine sediment metagenome]
MTFSIVARCPRTGMLAVATSSKALAAGGMVPYCRAGVGAIASQSFVNPYLGIEGITLLEQGLAAARVLERIIESDRGRDLRQVAIIDRDGHTAAYTGDKCIPWAGQVEGRGHVCLGNILVGEDVAKAMAHAFEASGVIDVAEPDTLKLYDEMVPGDVAFVCVPTPFDGWRGWYDTSAVEEVCERVPVGVITCLRSTVSYANDDVHVVHPEFLRQAHADDDFRSAKVRVYGIANGSREHVDVIEK